MGTVGDLSPHMQALIIKPTESLNKPPKVDNITQFSHEVLVNIGRFLDHRSRLRLGSTCRFMRQVMNDNMVWYPLYRQLGLPLLEPISDQVSAKEIITQFLSIKSSQDLKSFVGKWQRIFDPKNSEIIFEIVKRLQNSDISPKKFDLIFDLIEANLIHDPKFKVELFKLALLVSKKLPSRFYSVVKKLEIKDKKVLLDIAKFAATHLTSTELAHLIYNMGIGQSHIDEIASLQSRTAGNLTPEAFKRNNLVAIILMP
jgi:hypothetical protein